MSPNGQIPANVSIDDGIPDYSGVGGISSIDSGLWAVIAMYEYVRNSGDVGFLRERLRSLQAAMNWLSARQQQRRPARDPGGRGLD